MTQISRFKLKEEILEKLNELTYEVLSKKSKEEFLLILQDLVSSTEKVMIAKRIAVIYLLTKGIEQTVICQTLKVSRSTTSRYALLIRGSDVIPKALAKLIQNEKTKLLVNEIFSFLFTPGQIGIDWSSAWERKKEISRIKRMGF